MQIDLITELRAKKRKTRSYFSSFFSADLTETDIAFNEGIDVAIRQIALRALTISQTHVLSREEIKYSKFDRLEYVKRDIAVQIGNRMYLDGLIPITESLLSSGDGVEIIGTACILPITI